TSPPLPRLRLHALDIGAPKICLLIGAMREGLIPNDINADRCIVIPAKAESSNRDGKDGRKQRRSVVYSGPPPTRGRHPERSGSANAAVIKPALFPTA